MFRFSERFHKHQRAQAEIAEAQAAFEAERRKNRRWRLRHPERKPDALLDAWSKNKLATSQDYSDLIVKFMSTFDGVSEANAMMRHGLEAPDAGVDLAEFNDLAISTFRIRVFELFAEQCGLSRYSREKALDLLIPQSFRTPVKPKDYKPFDMAEIPLTK